MPPADPDVARWYAEEVQPHERELRAYLRARFSSTVDVDDLVQETLARLLEARTRAPVRSPKSYLFATAKNAVWDIFRRRKVAAVDAGVSIEDLSVAEDRPGVAEMASQDQEMQLVAEAVQTLPGRCREIFVLRKFDGLSHREIAARLGISENTVNAQLAAGMLRVRDFLRARGLGNWGRR